MKLLKKKKILLIMAAFMLLSIVFSGCGKSEQSASSDSEDEKVTLTYWVRLDPAVSRHSNNFGETPLAKKLQELTNINVEYQHPPQGQEAEKFNILVASNELPDIIGYNWLSYPGGPEKAIKDKVIVDIYDYREYAPNLIKVLESNDEYRKLAITDSGQLFSFPFIRGDRSLQTSAGLVIRQDWLDDLGLSMPETIEEWEEVLIAFRDKKGAEAPLSLTQHYLTAQGVFTGAYGIVLDYYLEDGRVTHGILEPGAKEFFKLMNKWYKEKLLDQNFATIDRNTMGANILNGTSGVVWGAIGGGIGQWMKSAPDDKFALEGAPVPVLNKGDIPKFGNYDLPLTAMFTAVTYDSQHKQEAMRFLDFGYGEEGKMLYNFGIEGESYNIVDDYPKYTELITEDPDGMAVALSRYTQSYMYGPFVQDKRYMEQYAALPEQKRAWETWSNTRAAEHKLPYLYLKEDELSEAATLNNAVNTYLSEMIAKLIIGSEPIENFEAVVEQARARGLDRILEMRQAAYDRYSGK